MMISPNAFYNENIKGKNSEEVEKEIVKLELQIKDLQAKVDNNEICLEKPDYKTCLQIVKSYLNYINDRLLIDKVFSVENKMDPIWEIWVKDLAVKILDCQMAHSKSLQEIFNELKKLSINEVDNYFKALGIEISEAPKTRQSILEIFIKKLANC